jgi:hypothetical protein
VGLTLYGAMLIWVLLISVRNVERMRDPENRYYLIALICGIAGIMAASYGNQVLGQIPTGILIPLAMHYTCHNRF